MLRHICQHFVIFIRVVNILVVALDVDRANHFAIDHQGRADAILIRSAFQNIIAFGLGSQEFLLPMFNSFACTDDKTCQIALITHWTCRKIITRQIDVVRVAQQVRCFIVKRNKEIIRIHQLAGYGMDARKKIIHTMRTIGGFGNFIQCCLDFVALQKFAGSFLNLLLQR